MVFCSTVHLASFLLPIAAYNNRISRLQVRGRQHWVGLSANWYLNISCPSPVLFELVLRAPQWPFASACQLFRLDSATRQEFPVVHTRDGTVLRFFCAVLHSASAGASSCPAGECLIRHESRRCSAVLSWTHDGFKLHVFSSRGRVCCDHPSSLSNSFHYCDFDDVA